MYKIPTSIFSNTPLLIVVGTVSLAVMEVGWLVGVEFNAPLDTARGHFGLGLTLTLTTVDCAVGLARS